MMAMDARSPSGRARLVYGLGCIMLGCYPLALSLGFLPVDEAALNAPLWVVAGAGFVFVIAGFKILLAKHSRANDLLAGALLFLFGIMGAWVSLFGSSEGFSGGLPIVSSEANVLLGRWIFGLGSLVSFALSVYAFRRAIRKSG